MNDRSTPFDVQPKSGGLLVFDVFPELQRLAQPQVMSTSIKSFQMVASQGQILDQVMVLVSGKMRSTLATGAIGRKVTIDEYDEDQIIALPEILGDRALNFDVESEIASQLISFPVASLKEIEREDPEFRPALVAFNSCSGVRSFARHLIAKGVSAFDVRTALGNAQLLKLQDSESITLPKSSATFALRGGFELISKSNETSRRLLRGEWLTTPSSGRSAEYGVRPLQASQSQLLIVNQPRSPNFSDALATFSLNCRDLSLDFEVTRSKRVVNTERPLEMSWMAANGYSSPHSALQFAASAVEAIHCTLSNIAVLLSAPVKLSLTDVEISNRLRKLSLGRMAELLERNGLITRAHHVSRSSLRSFDYPALAMYERLPVVLLSADANRLVILHPTRKLLEIDLNRPNSWNGRVLRVERSEFEDALELARKKNFQNDRKLLGEFGLGGIFKKERLIFRNLIGFAVFGALCEALLPLFVEFVVDRVLVRKEFNSSTTYIIGSVLLLVFISGAKFIERACRVSQMQKIGLKVRRLFIRNMMQVTGAHYGESMSSDFYSRLSLIDKIVRIKTTLATNRTTAYIECAIYLALLATMSLGIGLLALIGSVLIVFVHRHNMEHIGHEVHGMSILKRHLRLRIGEQFALAGTIKDFLSESTFVGRSEQAYFDHLTSIRKMTVYERKAKVISSIVSCCVGALSLALLTHQAFHDAITPGEFVAVMMLLHYFSRPAEEIGTLSGEQKFLEIEEGSIAQYLIQGEYSYQSRITTEPKRLLGQVRFEKVSFRYDNIAGNSLVDVNFSLSPGQVLAIVGRSGSGKTTVGRIIAGLVKPSFGNVSYDGIDSKSLASFTIFDQVGHVSSKNTIFSGSILTNIAFGDDDLDFERVRQATDLAGATEFIEKLPAGWQHVLTTGGPELSSGEIMQICVARALYRCPKILVLDELGANLDPRLVQLICENLTKMPEPITLIVITQRLATIKKVDNIIVMKNGSIVEEGRHGQLLKARREYAELYRSQVSVV